MVTCQDFRLLATTNLFENTVAERVAHKRHYQGCSKCKQWLDDFIDCVLTGLPPEVVREVAEEAASKKEDVLKLAASDRFDPEA